MSKPSKAAPAYSSEQMEEFARQFAPKARRYRLQSRMGIGGFLVCLVGGMIFAPAWPMAFLIGFVLGVGFWLFTAIRMDFLPACPACRGDIGQDFGKFCRECGLKLIENADCRNQMICPSGEHSSFTFQGKYRRGPTRHCPQCALRLDEKGL